jgi:hypothetical protein
MDQSNWLLCAPKKKIKPDKNKTLGAPTLKTNYNRTGNRVPVPSKDKRGVGRKLLGMTLKVQLMATYLPAFLMPCSKTTGR